MSAEFPMAGVLAVLCAETAWFLALVLAGAALHKLYAQSRARRAAAELLGVSWRGAGLAVWVAAATEGLAALCVVNPSSRGAGASLAAVLFAVYLGVMARAIFVGRRQIDCGCSFGTTHRPLGSWQILRTASLMLLAAAVAGLAHGPAVREFASVYATSPGELACESMAALAFLALYVALDHVLALRPLRDGVLG